jgi:hypothetical protein
MAHIIYGNYWQMHNNPQNGAILWSVIKKLRRDGSYLVIYEPKLASSL